jgi:SAM-dependent methyltransferase
MKYNLRLSFHYGLTIFLSAFLLFQVQPLIGKMILPWFGGSASVWTICMLFFQAILLFGYVYSHWIVKALHPYKQSMLHISLLAFSLLLLPITASDLWKPTGSENPTLQILGLLFVSIGLPYFVLSTTGPLIQAWFAREKTGGIPYRLFALSNLGSMLALMAYPIAFEPVLSTWWQSYCWSALYVIFVIACGILAWRNRNSETLIEVEKESCLSPQLSQLLTWILLAACPSILMVADTSFLTENIAPIPMIWVAPLALYLLSFIICFERDGWYQRKLFLPLLVVALFTLAYLPTMGLNELPILVSMGINLSAFFVVCMVCHGELAMQQPSPQHLTTYYLMLAVGGVLGGFFVGVIAPNWFNSNYELSVGILLTGIVVTVVLLSAHLLIKKSLRLVSIGGIVSFLILLGVIRVSDHLEDLQGVELSDRNFYGTLKVYFDEEGGYRAMRHGQISHGSQFVDPNRLLEPTTYYIRNSGVGKAILIKKASSKSIKIGVVGLGVGTLAAYGRSEDIFRFYEINPQVIEVANQNFTFISKSLSKKEIVLGDARLQLEQEPSQQFDVLVIDAFSGDSVPVHLLTQEAFAQYFRHLKKDGVLAIHITNRFLDLKPVMKMAADQFGHDVQMVIYEPSENEEGFRSHWALMTKDKHFFKDAALVKAIRIDTPKSFKPWRDDYSSLISVMY